MKAAPIQAGWFPSPALAVSHGHSTRSTHLCHLQDQPDPHPPEYWGCDSSWDALNPLTPWDSPDPPLGVGEGEGPAFSQYRGFIP